VSQPALPAPRPVLYLRSALFWLGFATSTMLFATGLVCLWVAPLDWRYKLVRGWPAFNLWWLRVTCGLSYHIEGWENLPDEPMVIYAKHQSTWETLAIAGQFPPAAFVAKRELLKIPFFGWGMASLKFLTIDRSAGKRAVKQIIEQAQNRFSHGLSVVIFPEGTRKAVGAEPDYKVGGALIAKHTGRPLVPVALNSGEYWPRHSFIKWPGEIVVKIGPPVDPEGKRADEITAEARDWIEARMAEMVVPNRFPY
jgi:1-acyl-sn-glycerol-3-phosphate acyltransferase